MATAGADGLSVTPAASRRRRSTNLDIDIPSDIFSNADDPLCAAGVDEYSFGTLTSFAAPHVVGAAAIIKSYLPGTNTREARLLLWDASVAPTPNLNPLQAIGGVLSLKKLRQLLP